ncbi:MAG: glycosyltransferase [Acetobacterium sp.]
MNPIVIIPALNPDIKLINLVEKLKKMDFHIVIINDGSKEACKDIFETLKDTFKCSICNHEKNMGKGIALKTGIGFAAKTYPDCCGYVTADADGQHTPEDILKVAQALKENPNSLVLGTRNFTNKDVPFKSRWGNRITSLVFSLSTRQRCHDTQTGLRGIPKKITETCLTISGNRFEYEMNMLLEIAKKRIPIVEVPIATIYLNDNQSSHFHAVKDSMRIYLNILKFSLSSFIAAIIDNSLFTLLMSLAFSANSTGILAATVLARLMSGCVNFMINKHWVFQSKNSQSRVAIQYAILFFSQMILSWFFVSSLSSLPLHLTLIKIMVDSGLFMLSYYIQKNIIFHNKEKGCKVQ